MTMNGDDRNTSTARVISDDHRHRRTMNTDTHSSAAQKITNITIASVSMSRSLGRVPASLVAIESTLPTSPRLTNPNR